MEDEKPKEDIDIVDEVPKAEDHPPVKEDEGKPVISTEVSVKR